MASNFIQYDYSKNKGYRSPFITITKNGIINFNTGVFQKFIQNNIYVVLHYDKIDNRIGFEFLPEDSTKAFKIKKSHKSNFGTIYGRPFLNFCDIPYVKTNKYLIEKEEETNLIIINLKKPERRKNESI